MTVSLNEEEKTLIAQHLTNITWVMANHPISWEQADSLVRWLKSDNSYIKDPHDYVFAKEDAIAVPEQP